MKNQFSIEIEGFKIGSTEFEYADIPMGVVFGKLKFENHISPYIFLKNYCIKNNIQLNIDDEKLKLIDTRVIPKMKVFDEAGNELIGWGGAITGIEDSENSEFEINFGGISEDIMKSTFEEHFNEYFGIQ